MSERTLTVEIFRSEQADQTEGSAAVDEPEPSDTALKHWATHTFSSKPTGVLSEHCLDSAWVSLALVEPKVITDLNRQYRNKNQPTNVLSFPSLSSSEQSSINNVQFEDETLILGDVVLCPAIIAEQAKAQNKSVSDHWAHLVVHGMLHLLGYDHIDEQDAEVMESLEIALLAKISVPNPYQDRSAAAI